MTERKRVLVVDDDPYTREAIEEILVYEGHEALLAEDGRAALALASTQRPDLILLDMRMPIMSGSDFAAAYRETPGPHAPIIVVTATVDAEAAAKKIGAAGYLAKPFGLDELLDLLERH
jgi:two-component system OmpR family response regulator